MFKGSDYNHKHITKKGKGQSMSRRGKRIINKQIGKKFRKLVRKIAQTVKFVLSDNTCKNSEKEDFLDEWERKNREIIDIDITPKFNEYGTPVDEEHPHSVENDIDVNLDIKDDENSQNYDENIYDIKNNSSSIENDNYDTPTNQQNPNENYESPENNDEPINPNGEDYLYYSKNIDQPGLDPEMKKKLNKKRNYKKLKHKKHSKVK